MERTRWWDYVERQMGVHGWSKADLSRATDVDQSVIGRWQHQGALPEARTMRAVALAFGRDVREVAVAAGLFTVEELTTGDAPVIDPQAVDLSVIPDERLRDEVFARMTRGRARRRPVKPRPQRREPARRDDPAGPALIAPAGGHVSTDVGHGAELPGPADLPADHETDAEDGISGRR